MITTAAALLLILLLGGYFRFVGLNWDEYTHLHPDERFLTLVTGKLERPGDFLTYLRTSASPLNPYNKGEGFYVYGNFPMTVTFYAGQAAEWLRGLCTDSDGLWCRYPLTGYDGIHLVGRLLSGVMDLITVGFTFLIGRRLYGRGAGLIAAFLMTTAVLPIQQSHFYTMDNWAAALSTMAFYAAVRASEKGEKYRWWVAFGVLLGLTVASRINVAPLALMAGVAGLVWLGRNYQRWQTTHPAADEGPETDRPEPGRSEPDRPFPWTVCIQIIVLGGMVAALVSMIVFRVAMPYAFADATIAQQALAEQNPTAEPSTGRLVLQTLVGFNPQWLSNMEEIQRLQAPEAMFPPALQWVDRAPILFPLVNMVLYGMGPAAGIIAWVAFGIALWRTVSGRRDWVLHALPVAWIALYFLFSATRWVKSIRYMLPIYPLLFVLAGWLLVWWWQRTDRKWRWVPGAAAVGVMAGSLLWANAFTNIYRQPMTRVAASNWMYENIPTAVSVVYHTADGSENVHNLRFTGGRFGPETGRAGTIIDLPEDGTVTAVRLNYVQDGDENIDDGETIQIGIGGAYGDPAAVAQTAVAVRLLDDEQTVTVPLDDPLTVSADNPLQLLISAGEGGSFVARTSVLTSEHWDDALPARINGRDPFSQYFRGLPNGPIPTTHPDSDQKRQQFYEWLEQADYYVITSQRSLWSLPRLPLTYPMMIEFYSSLFDGDLGYELVAEFHGPIRLGPLHISDTTGQIGWGEHPNVGWPPPGEPAAEEAFSVYDHPPVWVFRKTDDFSRQRLEETLGAVDLSTVVTMNPLEATNAVHGLMLTEAQETIQQRGGTFADIFNPDGVLSQNGLAAAVVWWLAVIILGWLAFPITFVIFPGLADRGYGISRILGLSLVAYWGWLLSSWGWASWTRPTLWLGILLLTAVGAVILAFRGREMVAYVRREWRLLLTLELVGVGLYLLQLVLRLGNPDAWHVIWGGEKPMDFSYFTAVMKSTIFPPYDPWLAGGYLNYYYYGYVVVGALTKLLGIVPTVAYNLILPMLYSFTGLGVFSLAYDLVRHHTERTADETPSPPTKTDGLRHKPALWAGGAATLLAVVLGNLREVGVLMGAWQGASSLPPDANPLWRTVQGGVRIMTGRAIAPLYPGDWFWTATRAISINEGEVAPITEFPFFTFLYGDLHAHMMALPLTVLALTWCVALVLHPKNGRGNNWTAALWWLVGAVAIGALYPTNSWDYPTYVVLGVLALVAYRSRVDGWAGWQGVRTAGRTIVQIVTLAGLSLLAFWPFWSDFGTGYSTISRWPGSYTPIGDYLAIYGLFVFIAVVYLFVDLKEWGQTWSTAGLARRAEWSAAAVGGLLLAIPLLFFGRLKGYEVLPVAGVMILFAGILGIRVGGSEARRVVNVLVSAAFGLTVFVEIFVLEGDVGRMNTVFKFYMQVWILLSVACGAGAVWVWQRAQQHWSEVSRTALGTAVAALVFCAALYPILATRAKWQIRENRAEAPLTLDGMQFMEYVSYGDKGEIIALDSDYHALRWMQENVPGSPVVAEAHSHNSGGFSNYRSVANRVAMYTGLPAVVGWDWHQRQQRTTIPPAVIRNRIADINQLYLTADVETAWEIIERYDIQYVYAGQLEIVYYGLEGVLKFDDLVADGRMEEVYRNDGTSIYRINN